MKCFLQKKECNSFKHSMLPGYHSTSVFKIPRFEELHRFRDRLVWTGPNHGNKAAEYWKSSIFLTD